LLVSSVVLVWSACVFTLFLNGHPIGISLQALRRFL
jgi:hypothetical protein